MSHGKRVGFNFHVSMTDDETGEEIATYGISYKHLPYDVFLNQIEPLAMKSVEAFVSEMYKFGVKESKKFKS